MAVLLLVDESQTIRRIVEWAFKGSGHDVVTATTANEGRQAVGQANPSVVIVNYALPDATGAQLCQAIKADRPGLPVVMLSGQFHAFDEAQARAAGADAIVAKPFKTDEILSPVLELVAQAQVAAPQAPPAPPASQPAAPTAAPRFAPPAVPAQAQAPSFRPAESSPATTAQRAEASQPRMRVEPGRAPAPPPPRRSTGPRPAQTFGRPAPARSEPSRRIAPASGQTAAVPSARVSQAARAVPQRASAPSAPMTTGASAVVGAVDRATLKAVVEEVLPSIVRRNFETYLADGFEARLRTMVEEFVQQELRRYQPR